MTMRRWMWIFVAIALGSFALAAAGRFLLAWPQGAIGTWVGIGAGYLFGALLFLLVGRYAPPSFLGHFTVFVLACFVGYMVVWNVKPALHTPLMSVTNAVSSIIAIGALVQIAPGLSALPAGVERPDALIRWLSVAALALATINMFGGFAVTRRMLGMLRK